MNRIVPEQESARLKFAYTRPFGLRRGANSGLSRELSFSLLIQADKAASQGRNRSDDCIGHFNAIRVEETSCQAL